MKVTYFKHARNIAKMSDYPRHKIGCIVVYDNKIIGMGFNSKKTHPLQKVYNVERFSCDNTPHCMHAEVHALAGLIHNKAINWKKVSIYNYRETKDGCLAMSKPCPSCMKLIKDLGIKDIYYTSNDGYVYEKIVDMEKVI